MKKHFLILFILILFSGKAFSLGAGVQMDCIPDLNVSFSDINYSGTNVCLTGTVRLMRLPVVLGFGIETGDITGLFSFGINGFADYWIFNEQIYNTLNFFAGIGLSGKLLTSKDFIWSTGANFRFVTGINYLFYDNYLELYIQNAISPGFKKVLPDGDFIFDISIPVEIGMRVHF